MQRIIEELEVALRMVEYLMCEPELAGSPLLHDLMGHVECKLQSTVDDLGKLNAMWRDMDCFLPALETQMNHGTA